VQLTVDDDAGERLAALFIERHPELARHPERRIVPPHLLQSVLGLQAAGIARRRDPAPEDIAGFDDLCQDAALLQLVGRREPRQPTAHHHDARRRGDFREAYRERPEQEYAKQSERSRP
jgi:hypothetical protein